eukprot:TRINITY_DN23920_c0_g2_i1.p1 TRINITY_DN23920_c0_g2~~TRINITY_DN23920_c0_g2_i1.p1  ORF type:complete len:424 (+),score=138.59 TRINITY_DN23920_c0_g2_i1:82-1272(+)
MAPKRPSKGEKAAAKAARAGQAAPAAAPAAGPAAGAAGGGQQQGQEQPRRRKQDSAMASGLRKLFIIPAIAGTYFWIQYLGLEMSVQYYKRARKGEERVPRHGWPEALWHVPGKLTERLWFDPSCRAAILEVVFLGLFGMLATHLVYSRRSSGGTTMYTLASMCSSGAFGLAMCNYLYPLADPMYTLAQQRAMANAPRGTLPGLRHLLFSAAAVGGVLWAALRPSLRWREALAIPIGYVALPLLTLILMQGKPRRNTVTRWRAALLCLSWAAAGAYLLKETRATLPIWDGGYAAAWKDPEKWLAAAVDALNTFEGPPRPPPGFLAFAAQVVCYTLGSAVFVLFDSPGGIFLLLRILWVPFVVAAPTAAVPLYFAFRAYSDPHGDPETEAAAAKKAQ